MIKKSGYMTVKQAIKWGGMTYFLPHDTARCNRDDCHLNLECARWLDRLPMEEYWYNQFEPEGCENFIEKDVESKKKKK